MTLLFKYFPPEITRKNMDKRHAEMFAKLDERLKNDKDKVGVEERLFLEENLFLHV